MMNKYQDIVERERIARDAVGGYAEWYGEHLHEGKEEEILQLLKYEYPVDRLLLHAFRVRNGRTFRFIIDSTTDLEAQKRLPVYAMRNFAPSAVKWMIDNGAPYDKQKLLKLAQESDAVYKIEYAESLQ